LRIKFDRTRFAMQHTVGNVSPDFGPWVKKTVYCFDIIMYNPPIFFGGGYG
jgi:hypothetical protein